MASTGLGLSFASIDDSARLELPPDFHIAGGPFSGRAENVMIEVAGLLARRGVSFVVETSVLSADLVATLRSAEASVLAVHVVASARRDRAAPRAAPC